VVTTAVYCLVGGTQGVSSLKITLSCSLESMKIGLYNAFRKPKLLWHVACVQNAETVFILVYMFVFVRLKRH